MKFIYLWIKKLSTMAVVYKNAGLFTFAIFALRDSGVKPLGY